MFRALIDELLVGQEEFTALIGPSEAVVGSQYPQAVAVALALRHSWNALDLQAFVRRLRLPSK